MTIGNWLAKSGNRIRDDGWSGAKQSAYEFYVGAWSNIGRRYNYGTSIWEDSWDICIILDACRWDLIPKVDYSYLTNESKYSVASSSGEWIPKTFNGRDNSEVAYVTANPYSKKLLNEDDFFLLDEVWEYGFDDNIRTIPADIVTDQAINAWTLGPEKLVIHYMQPHHPFVPKPMDEGLPRQEFNSQPWDNVWHKLRKGDVDREEVWSGYSANLDYVLEHVDTFLNNVSGEVLITSDHGNLLGEWRMYAHPDWVPLPALKRVPWVKTKADNMGEYEPIDHQEQRERRIDRNDQLEALGYR